MRGDTRTHTTGDTLQGMEAFEQLVVQKKEQEKEEKDAAMDQLQAGIAALKVQQHRDQERQRRKEEEKRMESLDYRALHSLRPRSDKRLRLVIDTNIFLEKLPSGCSRVCDVWDKFEREHAATAKVLIPQVVFEEIDRKRRHHDSVISSQARAMMRYLDAKFTSRACSSGDGFWELQVCVCVCVYMGVCVCVCVCMCVCVCVCVCILTLRSCRTVTSTTSTSARLRTRARARATCASFTCSATATACAPGASNWSSSLCALSPKA